MVAGQDLNLVASGLQPDELPTAPHPGDIELLSQLSLRVLIYYKIG